MHQPIESNDSNGLKFHTRTTIPGNNMNWNIGTATIPHFEAAEGSLTLAAAKTKTGMPVLLWPTLLTSNGQIEAFQLINYSYGKKAEVPLSNVDTDAIGKMLDIANDEKLHGFAAEGSLKYRGGEAHPSHEIVVDGQRARLSSRKFSNLDTPIACLLVTDSEKKTSKNFILNVSDVEIDGKISASTLMVRDAAAKEGWSAAPEGSLPPRALEELTRFAEKHKHFGHASAAYADKLENRATDILANTDLDADLAKLLSAHHEKALDNALEKGDAAAAKSASEEARSHREAAEKLSKPKTHSERVKFEREQQQKLVENGDIERFSR